jgi:hypothetical protein
VNIFVRGVTFGGPAPDQGFTVTNNGAPTLLTIRMVSGLCVTNQI